MEKNNNMNLEVVKGKVFIIPNCPRKLRKDDDDYSKKWFRNILSHWGTDDDTLIEIWVKSLDCDCWNDRMKEINGKVFPRYIPLKLIKNLKEGETIRVKCNGVEIDLTADQLTDRYRVFGKFEEVLRKIL